MSDLPADLPMEALINTRQRAQWDLAELVGQLKAHEFHSKFANIAHLKILAELKASKAYKSLTVKNTQGELVMVRTWDDLCTSLGVSTRLIDENLLNLETLGEEFLDKARALGLGYRDINKLRKLPDDNRALVLGRVSVDVGDKEAIVDLIDELAGKHAQEKAALQAALDKQTNRVDAIVDTETKGLKQEVAALVQERDALQKQVADPAWANAKQAADAMWAALQAFKDAARTFERVRPAGEIPLDLGNSIDTVFYSINQVVEHISLRWAVAKEQGEGL